ncbi:unnamed protein product [Microthlaspi erraticum]|uniref:Uncharacterized protein n=1 Tax=Microthlaspi erraticum TaxID=1685480 RepID=A0A6D2J5W5_9BRAS|nr:unnamed protein product [Microthlaspi erraticum]
MSRKGVTTKRVKTVQTALSRISAQTAQRLAEKRLFRARPKPSVRLKSRPKFKTIRPTEQHDREAMSRGRPSQDHSMPCRGRPKARFEARFHIFMARLTLSRLKRPSTIYIAF